MSASFMQGSVTPFYVSAGISAVSSILGARAASKAAEAQLNAVKGAISESKNDYIRQLNSMYEKEALVEQETREMLSARGLEALKAESRLRVGASGTGVIGSSMQEEINQSKYDQLFDATVTIGRARKAKADISREKVSQYIAFKNRTSGYANQMQGADTSFSSALMSGLASGLSAFAQGVAWGGKLPTGTSDSGFTTSALQSTQPTFADTYITRQSTQPSIWG